MNALSAKKQKLILRGIRNLVGWIIIGTVFAITSAVIAGCQKGENDTPKIYRMDVVESSVLEWETNPENNRQKVPVLNDAVYFVVGGAVE